MAVHAVAGYNRVGDEVQQALRRERIFRDRLNPLDAFDDVDLYNRYRFDQESKMWNVDLLQAQIEHVTRRNHALSPTLQVLAALRFYATGSFQSVLGDTIQVHKSTVSRVVEKISAILANRRNQFIQFPDNDDFAEISRQFFVPCSLLVILGQFGTEFAPNSVF